jgi:uncharacterized protein YggE
LGFTNTNTSVSAVQNEANTIINSVSAAVKRLGINEKDIKTTNYSLYPNYDYRSSVQKITGYSINVNILVKVRDFSKINQVIDTGTGNGANQVGGLSFTFDDPEKYQTQARKIAIETAKKKASDIANASGIMLGKLINVQEGSGNNYRPAPMMAATEKSDSTQIEPGSSEIISSVTLNYEVR